jgi:hypothetical protein
MPGFASGLRLWIDRRPGGIVRIALIATIGGLAASWVAQAGEPVTAAERVVTVCLDGGPSKSVRTPSKAMASQMFAAIGVTVNWHEGLKDCPPHGILLSLTEKTPAALFPGALGYSLPYEGSHIRLFYDRISQERPPMLVPALLAHVMVHEITHMLEGINEHSTQGIMKARWTQDDFSCMIVKPLSFSDRDIDTIYRGLAARTARFRAAVELSARL